MSEIKLIPTEKLVQLVEDYHNKTESDYNNHISATAKKLEDRQGSTYPAWVVVDGMKIDMHKALVKIRNFQKMLLLAMFLKEEISITNDDCQYFDMDGLNL